MRRAGNQVRRHQEHAVGTELLGCGHAGPCLGGPSAGPGPDGDAAVRHLEPAGEDASLLVGGEGTELAGAARQEQGTRLAVDVALDALGQPVQVQIEVRVEGGERKGEQTLEVVAVGLPRLGGAGGLDAHRWLLRRPAGLRVPAASLS